MPIEYPVCLFIRPPCDLHASVRTPSASKFTDPDTHRRIAYDAFANIRDAIGRASFPSCVAPPPPPPSKRSRVERRDERDAILDIYYGAV